ncbi:MAG TPA: permease prefix domain 1-containing protein [Pilimelia sp.]|nr:permease prefix domain 1-containing protein [Pilimelia sp.]
MTSLTDRYLAATRRAVPAARREGIAAELRALIEDMIDARTGAGQDAASAEREVLAELGDPERLAARYTGRRPYLLGPTYYPAWERLVTLLLSFVPLTVGALVGLLQAADGDNVGGAVGQGVSAAFQVAVQIVFWVTLVFVVLERTNTPLELPAWSVDQLPRVPVERQIGLADTAASVAFLALVIVFLPLQHLRSFATTATGDNLPLLDPALWGFWLPWLIGVLVAAVGVEIAKYRAGCWTWPLVGVNAMVNAAFAVPVVWLLLTGRMLNPELVRHVDWLARGDNLDRVATVVAVGTVLVVLWDTVDSVVRAYRSRGCGAGRPAADPGHPVND